jgi:transcriptional regulator with XRE-family HTH domain
MLLDYLKKEFKSRKKKNSSYSVRAYARDLQMDSSVLSKILSGKRKLTFNISKKIVAQLTLDESVKRILLLTYLDEDTPFRTDEDYFVPDENLSAELMSRWEYYAVLSYLEINDSFDPPSIALSLKTDEKVVSQIIDNLLRLQIIEDKGTTLKLVGKNLTAPKSFNNASLIQAHKEYIEKSVEMLLSEDRKRGDFSGMTFSMPAYKYKEALEQIKTFRRTFAKYLSPKDSEKADGVYRINIQFFPLSTESITETPSGSAAKKTTKK